MIGVMEERPPFVTFERRAIEKRMPGPPAGDGSLYFEDQDFAIITPQGTRDKVEKVVADWFGYLEEMAKNRRYNPEWLKGFRAMYQAWKEQRTIPLNGFPIVNWPVASPSEAKKLTEMHIMTVEDLAVATEEAVGRLGMGGRSLRQRAVDWITAQSGNAPLVSKLDAMRVSMETLSRQFDEMKTRNETLERQVQQYQMREIGAIIPEPQGSLEDRLSAAQEAGNREFDNLTKL